MSSESLIANVEYNTRMDSNVNILENSFPSTIFPEELSYVINILDIQVNISQEQQDKLRLFNEKIKMKQLLLLKIVVILFIILGGVIIYFIFH